MKKFRIYLDTSVISHLFHDDAPQRRDETREFFEKVRAAEAFETYVSKVVLDELGKTRDAILRAKLLATMQEVQPIILPSDPPKVAELADAYQRAGIVPPRQREDSLHVAYATIFEMDYLVTWNYRHLARPRIEALIGSINLSEGYTKPLRLITPLQLVVP